MIYEVHRKVKDNVGDYFCNPGRYFSFPDYQSGELLYNEFPVTGQNLIIGGGGLIHKKFSQHIESLINKNPKHTVLWGIGHNYGRKAIYKGFKYYPDFVNKCSLVGIRDWIAGSYDTYLPCVSCMHPAFDIPYETKHDIAFFLHSFKTKYQPNANDVVLENNNLDIDNAIKFLGEADTVVTDSYHGAYWAQLLGKKVKVVSWSIKFEHFKYPVTKIDAISNHKDYNGLAVPKDFLEESRELNRQFYNKARNLFC